MSLVNHENRPGRHYSRQLDERPVSHDMDGFDLLQLLDGCRQKHFAAKEVIYREGDEVDKVFIIQSGKVKLLSYLPNGRARIVRLRSRNDWLGLDGLTGLPYEQTAVAVGDVEVTYVPMSRFQRLEKDNPQLYCEILKQGYNALVKADRWISDFSTGGVKPRVASLINFLSRLEYGDSSNQVELLRVHDMADILGVTAESVSRTLAEFKRNHTLQRIERGRSDIYQVDKHRLHSEIMH